ncbi:hypothetical protein ACOL3L_10695 [Aliarcobacter butzleri]|uniref:hypothetical protein n=2 Tax=Aliarcobacter butzleri TaxID=28197 RepID=UPI003B7F6799
MYKEYLLEIIIYILSLIIALIIGYLMSYFKEKAKNKALLEDNSKLIAENEEIKQKYAVDLQKRKYKYEQKQKLYFEFMNKLDKYNAMSMSLIFDNLGSLMMKYYQAKTKEEMDKFTIQFNEEARNIDTEMKKQLSELFSQMNELKLTTSDESILLINELHDELMQVNNKFLSIPDKILSYLQNPNSNTNLKKYDSSVAKKIMDIKNQLTKNFRDELDNM